jgi:hypothetical protein
LTGQARETNGTHTTVFFWIIRPCCILTGKSQSVGMVCAPPTLGIEAEYSSERLISTYKTIRNHSPEDNNLNTYGYEKLKT